MSEKPSYQDLEKRIGELEQALFEKKSVEKCLAGPKALRI